MSNQPVTFRVFSLAIAAVCLALLALPAKAQHFGYGPHFKDGFQLQ